MEKPTKDELVRLKAIAAKLPETYIESIGEVMMKGSDIYLTPAFKQGMIMEGEYPVEVPQYTMVNHLNQLLIAFDRDGWKGVDIYSIEVLWNCEMLGNVDVVGMILKANGVEATPERIMNYVAPVYSEGGIEGVICNIEKVRRSINKAKAAEQN